MKFEEVLPKMRDEGRVGVIGLDFFKFENGFIWKRSSKYSPWVHFPRIVEDYFTSDDWAIEPVKVKKWQWVFGNDIQILLSPPLHLTKDEAEIKRVLYSYSWKNLVAPTEIESYED